MKKYVLHPIPLWRVEVEYERPFMTYLHNYGKSFVACIYVWFIEGTEKNIVIDAGGTAEMSVARGRSSEQVTHIQSLEEGISKFGLKPGDIDIVILTHLHWDHISLARLFTNAKFIVQGAELECAYNPHPVARQQYDKSLFEGLNFEVVNGDVQIVEGIRVLLTPGHSPGAQSVAIETEKGVVVVTGFCCLQENFEPSKRVKRETAVILPGIHFNAMEAYDSMIRVKEVADIIIANHEPEIAHKVTIP